MRRIATLLYCTFAIILLMSTREPGTGPYLPAPSPSGGWGARAGGYGLVKATAQDAPNILLIIADDLGVDRLNGYHAGDRLATTPTLDSLRRVGLTFTNAVAAPACSPSRAALLTGQYGVKNGVTDVPGNLATDQPSLFRELDAGPVDYAHALIGKWHLSRMATAAAPYAFGMDYYDGVTRGNVTDYYSWTRDRDGVRTTESEYVTTALTNATLDWVDGRTRPWFVWLAHTAPHSPYHVPPAGLFTVGSTNGNVNQYLAMTEALDHEVGRLLASLTPEARANTLVIFVGDNGTPANVMQDYPTRRGKGTLYQGGIRVPLIVAGHGVTRAGEREDALVHIADLHATILEAAGRDLPGGILNSNSFYDLLSDGGADAGARVYNYVERGEDWMIRTATHKLIQLEDGTRELYAVATDSFELNNLLTTTPLPQDLALIRDDLLAEGLRQRTDWSCRDRVKNGEETGIDCGTADCGACTTSTTSTRVTALRLSPNPAGAGVTLPGRGAVRVWDAAGRLVLSEKTTDRFSVSDFREGVYLVELRVAGERFVGRLVVQR